MRTASIKRRLLEHRRDLLVRYRNELSRADEELEARDPEQVETATEQWDARLLSRLGDADAVALGRIVAALRRLDDGTYGRCTDCGGKIAASRLSALPEAATCFDCAAATERGAVAGAV